MRASSLFLLLLLAPLAVAQPARDEAGITAAFAEIVALAHADDVEGAMVQTACPVENPTGGDRPIPGACDPASAEHRARVEWQLALLRRLFPEEVAARHAIYNVETEGDEAFHLLLFQDLPEVPYALVSFIMVDGAPLFGEVQADDLPEGVPAPPSLVAALDGLLAAAADPDTTPETFAPLLVATSGDAAWRTPATVATEDERAAVASVLLRLRGLLASHDGYAVVGFESDRESEGTWHVLIVEMTGAEGEPVAFAFLPLGNAFLLGDIDG